MKLIALFALLMVGAMLKVTIQGLWDEWSGAFGRWRKGEPLRRSELLSIQWQEARERHAKRKAAVRHAYETNPRRILNPQFRREFKYLLIDKDIRGEVIRRCGPICGACGRTIKGFKKLHVDHIKPKLHYPELEFWPANLQVLCVTCNAHKSSYDGADWKEVVAARRKVTTKKRAAQARVDRAKNKSPIDH